MNDPAPKRLAKKRSRGPVIAVAVVAAVLALVVGGYFGLCAWVQGNGLLLPGTTVTGLPDGQSVDLSGLDASAAAQLLEQRLESDLSGRTLTVTYGEGKSARLEGDLLEADPSAPVNSALAAKEEQPFYMLGLLWLGLGDGSQHTASALVLTDAGQTRVESLARQIAQELYVAPVDFTYELTDESVEVTLGTDGQQVDQEALVQDITDALISGQQSLSVTAEVAPSAELSGEILSQLVYVAPQSSTVGADGKLTPTVVGHSVDAAEAQTILDGTQPGQTCSIPLIYLQPDLGEAEELLYRDKLAESETYMSGPENRRTNIRLAAAAVDGTILMPGETFSYNKTVGERTAAKGYKPATVYVAGLDKQELGGGICQLASALYYCTLYSDLEVVDRINHRFAVTYVPHGLDATVAWGSIDYKFKNDTDYPIRISAYTEGTNLIVVFYGTKADDSYVEMETRRLSSTPYSTVYQIDESLAAGQTKTVTSAYTGYKYEVYRCVYDGNGNLISRTFENTSTYAYRDKVIAVSPADAAQYGLGGEVAPSPSPSPDPSPSADPTPSPSPSETPSEAPSESPSEAPSEPVSPDPGTSPDTAASAAVPLD